MQIFDYRINPTISNELSEVVDKLSQTESEKLLSIIKTIKKDSKQAISETWKSLIESAILPALKCYAEQSFSILETEYQEQHSFIATLKNEHGFDISKNDKNMKYLCALSDTIEINTNDEWTILSLIFSAA